jgi:hypothetical protein
MQDDILLELATLRENLKDILRPEVLNKLVDFIEACGSDNSMLERYKYFCETSEDGPDCRYAAMAKKFFLEDRAKGVAETINWLYENWSRFYKEGESADGEEKER